MKDGIEIKIINRQALEWFVEGLHDFEKDEAINEGLKKGGNLLKRGGKRRLKTSMNNPNGVTGNLMKSFLVKTKRYKLGVLTGFKKPIGNHAHLIDKGTYDRYTKKGYYRGRLPSNRTSYTPYFWSETKDEDMTKAQHAVVEGLTKAVERIKERHS